MSIVCDDSDGEEKEYCNAANCGGLVVPLNKNGDSVCTLCERIYPQNSTKLHRKKLQPDDQEAEPIFIGMTNYNFNKKKIPTAGDREDAAFVRQGRGRSIIDYEDLVCICAPWWTPSELEACSFEYEEYLREARAISLFYINNSLFCRHFYTRLSRRYEPCLCKFLDYQIILTIIMKLPIIVTT